MRQQHVPGLVADPVAAGGGRDDRRREHQRRPRRQVVRRRAARAAHARAGPPTGCSGPTSRTPTSARSFTPVGPEPAAGRAGAGPALRRLPRDPRPAPGRRDPRLQRLHRDAPGAVPDAGHADHARPARGGLGGADLRDPRRAAERSSTGPRRVDLVDCRGRRRVRGTSTSPTRGGAAGARRTSTCTCSPGETVAMVGRTASGKTTVATPAARASTTSPAARSGSTATTSATSRSRACARQIGVVLDEPFLFSVSIRDNIAYGRPDARSTRFGPRPAPPAPSEFIDGAPGRLRHGRRRARLHALGRAAPADRDRAHAAA